MPHTSSQRPALGVIFVLISCLSLQFGATFAMTLFPLFGALAITVSRLTIASIVVGSAVWLAAHWHTRRGGETPPGTLSWSKEQWRAVIIFGLMNGFFYCGDCRLGAAESEDRPDSLGADFPADDREHRHYAHHHEG